MSDHRASADYRSAMLGNALRRLWAQSQETSARDRGERAMSELSRRPDEGVVVGKAMPHESAALHVTGHALYTDDLVATRADVLHA